ncbi:MAG: transcription antitermination factor NusB [Nitrospirae bacterium]|nr:transcription antitermination factor NusB [Nitrospirota bacterium]MBF0541019.1 transcription antitermination factor NusB [Nitrospirota bacterium]
MTRRQAREYVLQMLFQYEFTGKLIDKIEIKYEMKDKGLNEDTLNFIMDLFFGTVNNIEHIDSIINPKALNWDIDRLAAVDRNILRASTYELLYRSDIPVAVTINEAVDIAKKYSTSESYSLINGILDNIAINCTKNKRR